MKNPKLKKIALLGITAGLVAGNPLEALSKNSPSKPSTSKNGCGAKNGCGGKQDSSDPHDENLGYHLMTEDELMMYLNAKGRERYNNLSPKYKELALKVASARCNQTNECSGLNACKTDTNDCAGQGSCKETGKCAFSDKNLAVKLVWKKMKEKRENLTK